MKIFKLGVVGSSWWFDNTTGQWVERVTDNCSPIQPFTEKNLLDLKHAWLMLCYLTNFEGHCYVIISEYGKEDEIKYILNQP